MNQSAMLAMMAKLQNQTLRPKYEVHEITEDDPDYRREKDVYGYERVKDEDTGKVYSKRVVEKKIVEGGYMVYFPRGHSIRVDSANRLRQMGFDRPAPLVDMDDGEEIEQFETAGLREMCERRTKLTPPERLEQLNEDVR